MVLAPLLGSAAVPVKVRIMIALVLSMAVFPLVPQTVNAPSSLAGLAVGVGSELLIGITMGFALSITFVGIQIGAELVGQQMGLSLARLVDPMTEVTTNVMSQFYLILATLIYIAIDGHLVLISSLIQTFDSVPLMGTVPGMNLTETLFTIGSRDGILVSLLSSAFMLGIRVAGPALVAIFLATLALGFISRTMPQLNILAAGFPVRITLALILLIASLGSVCVLFRDNLLFVLGKVGTIFL
jgi:flagellar biosynthetic protein FliR